MKTKTTADSPWVKYEFVVHDTLYCMGGLKELLVQLTGSSVNINYEHLGRSLLSASILAVRHLGHEKLIGFAMLYHLYGPQVLRGRIHHFVVDEKYRERGIGRMMLEKLIEEAKRLKMQGIDLNTREERVAAQKLYEACGFKRRGSYAYRLKL